MKLFVLIFVFALFLALTGCGNTVLAGGDPVADAKNTLTAAAITPSPTATSIPNQKAIVVLINDTLEKGLDPLSKTLDADYQVVDIYFIGDANGYLITFRVDVRCTCVNNTNCCTTERTFVVIANTLKAVREKIINQMPPTVANVQVSCFDHYRQIGTAVVSWGDLVSYFTEKISGDQLGSRVFILPGQ